MQIGVPKEIETRMSVGGGFLRWGKYVKGENVVSEGGSMHVRTTETMARTQVMEMGRCEVEMKLEEGERSGN